MPETLHHGGDVPGATGIPLLTVTGTLDRPSTLKLEIDKTPPRAPGVLVVGAKRSNVPIFGGILVPTVDVVIALTGNGGVVRLGAATLKKLPAGSTLFAQAGFADRSAKRGIVMSHGIEVRT